MNILNYRLATYTKGVRDYVTFWAWNPVAQKLERVRWYQDHIKDAALRAKTAKLICKEVNTKLVEGWSPFAEKHSVNSLLTIEESINKIFLLKTNGAEARTISTYKSRVTIFMQWLKLTGHAKKPIYTFDHRKALDYMDYLLSSKKISSRTYNGYLTDMRTFFNAMLQRGYLGENPFSTISKRKEQTKKRVSFTPQELLQLKAYLVESNLHFLAVCYYCYYAALRPVEICRLKVECIDFENRTITILPDQAKNDQQHTIPIVQELYDILLHLQINKAPKNYYLVSRGFAPGKEKLREDKIARYFKKVKDKLQFKSSCTFYSLKDTIAERLLQAGYEIKFIQLFFRHHDISITDAYMSSFNPIVNKELLANFPKM